MTVTAHFWVVKLQKSVIKVNQRSGRQTLESELNFIAAQDHFIEEILLFLDVEKHRGHDRTGQEYNKPWTEWVSICANEIVASDSEQVESLIENYEQNRGCNYERSHLSRAANSHAVERYYKVVFYFVRHGPQVVPSDRPESYQTKPWFKVVKVAAD